jgi:hypothetical protein
LDAVYLVESSISAQGEKYRITSKLIRVHDQVQIWSSSYERQPNCMLEFQRELSSAIAEQIRLRLSPDRLDALARRQTRDPERTTCTSADAISGTSSRRQPHDAPSNIIGKRQNAIRDMLWPGLASPMHMQPVRLMAMRLRSTYGGARARRQSAQSQGNPVWQRLTHRSD